MRVRVWLGSLAGPVNRATLDALSQHLSPRQIEAIAGSSARVNIYEGAIRSGKTVASLLAWLIFVAQAPTNGELVMIGKTSQTLARNIFTPLANPEIFGPFAKHVQYTQGAPTARILGRRVHVIGANDARSESKIRGMTIAGTYVDELSLLPNEEFFDQLLARMSVLGARLIGTTNPDSPGHWLKRDVLDAGDPDVRSWHFTLDDNPFLPAETIAFYKRLYVGLFYRRFVLGQWVAGEGAIYEMFDADRHVVDIVPQVERWVGVGIDYGTANPFHALLMGLALDPPSVRPQKYRLYIAGEWRYDGRRQRHQLTDVEYSERVRDWLGSVRPPGAEVAGVRPSYVVVDPSAASFIAQLHRDGLNPYPADNSVLDGIRLVSSLLAADLLKIHRSCTALIDELPGYSWDDRAALLGEDKPIKVDDHGVDACRYLCATTESIWRPRVRLAA